MQTKTIFAAAAGVATVAVVVGGFFYKKNAKAKEVKPDYGTMLAQAQAHISFLLPAVTKGSSTLAFAKLITGMGGGGINYVNSSLDKQTCWELAEELAELSRAVKRYQISIGMAEPTGFEINAMEKLFTRITEIGALVNMK